MAKAIIRTSDRLAFKRCRRKWSFISGLRQNRAQISGANYFWIGTGGHYALEDYHGYNHYGHPAEAFKAYVEAWRRLENNSKYRMPDDWQQQAEMGDGLMHSYMSWLQDREPLETLWIDGVPQCEVRALIKLPIEHPLYDEGVFYSVTLDRVVWYDDGLWLQDYKFYKNFSQANLEFDQQMSAYIWAGTVMYTDSINEVIQGAILQEHRKNLPNEPRVLQSGEISGAQNQGTTRALYKKALEEKYGSVDKATDKQIECLNNLASMETDHRDGFVRRHFTVRAEPQIVSTGQKILMEAEDMLNPNLPIYPNETKDCQWDCPLQEVCLMMDTHDDWQYVLETTTTTREDDNDNWRTYLP